MYYDPSLYNWSDYTILIVEDDVSSTFFLKEVLKDTQVNILHASNGQEAVDFFKSETKPDLVLMDIKMPVMNGYDATKAIRQISPEVPIIAQTANAVYDARISCREAGCSDFIAKPIDSVELIEMIAAFLK
jgi:two-component system, cell cycle response regulator DivK